MSVVQRTEKRRLALKELEDIERYIHSDALQYADKDTLNRVYDRYIYLRTFITHIPSERSDGSKRESRGFYLKILQSQLEHMIAIDSRESNTKRQKEKDVSDDDAASSGKEVKPLYDTDEEMEGMGDNPFFEINNRNSRQLRETDQTKDEYEKLEQESIFLWDKVKTLRSLKENKGRAWDKAEKIQFDENYKKAYKQYVERRIRFNNAYLKYISLWSDIREGRPFQKDQEDYITERKQELRRLRKYKRENKA